MKNINIKYAKFAFSLIRLQDWYHYVFICSICFFIFNSYLSISYVVSLFFLLSGIYMLNDFFDLAGDSFKADSNNSLILFRKEKQTLHRNIFTFFLAISLWGLFSVSFNRFIIASSVIIIMYLYSTPKTLLKAKPGIDLFSIFLTYALLVLTAFNTINLTSILLSSFIGLLALDAHILQCIRDYEVDSKCNVNTFALYLGKKRSLIFFRALVALTVFYTGFLLYKIFNIYNAVFSLILLPLIFEKTEDPVFLWKRLKFLSGLIFCYIVIGLVALKLQNKLM